jgi:hypothetical protein
MIYVCSLWYMWVVTETRGIFVTSIKYRPLSVIWIKWKVALKPRRKIVVNVKFILL